MKVVEFKVRGILRSAHLNDETRNLILDLYDPKDNSPKRNLPEIIIEVEKKTGTLYSIGFIHAVLNYHGKMVRRRKVMRTHCNYQAYEKEIVQFKKENPDCSLQDIVDYIYGAHNVLLYLYGITKILVENNLYTPKKRGSYKKKQPLPEVSSN